MTTEKFASRLNKPLKQWVKCIVWSLIYILFVVWVGTYGWLVGLPIVVDAFITKYIPWTWWKSTKNKALLAVFGWIDAIVFALVAVYFINTYLFQNYQIPTPSLEKSLLVGDFLFVSKASYGPRVPNTPLSFPLVQHTLPVLNCKSFIENPQWDYKRLKGFDTVKRNDIVVFNFPAGDTVALNMQTTDYYSLCYYNGRDIVHSRPDIFGEIVYRPVDRRENYVKRCVAIPGDWFEMRDNQVYINGKKQDEIEGLQLNYFVQTNGTLLTADLREELNISNEDWQTVSNTELISQLGLDPSLPVYHFPLTKKAYNQLTKTPGIQKLLVEPVERGGEVYPLGGGKKWNRDNYGPIWVPKKGMKLKLNTYNLPIYERIIVNYEHNTLEVKNGIIYINNHPATTYQFKMDYYWMLGDNRHNSADSRYWGFVPEDHVVGRPVLVWLSLNKDKGLFDGKIRWNRFFKWAEQ